MADWAMRGGKVGVGFKGRLFCCERKTEMATLEYLTTGEAKIARRLISEIMAEGYSVSVYDGEETTLKRSRKFSQILAAMGTTGSDVILARDKAGECVARFLLVYGNAEDGSELISDHSDNDIAEEIYSALGLE